MDELVRSIFHTRLSAEEIEKMTLPSAMRIENASRLGTDMEKFRQLTDSQLREQWRGDSLTLLSPRAERTYLQKITNLHRGDRLNLKRVVSLHRFEFFELLNHRLNTSLLLATVNYDKEVLHQLYKMVGVTPEEAIKHQVEVGTTAISTTYGTLHEDDGSELDYDPDSDLFTLRLRISVPVEAIVILPINGDIPAHVRKNPSGFAFAYRLNATSEEAEITFLDWIPREWVMTDYESIARLAIQFL